MYLGFYGLTEKPFSLTPDPKFLYLGGSHRAALEHLIYGINQKEGFMMISGEVGTGKTTVCRAMMEKLDQKTKSALILNPQLSAEELLAAIVSEFGIDYSKESGTKDLIDRLNQFLLDQLASGYTSVLIIDEAQNIPFPVMEQIRMLSNLETDKEKLLQILLIGQTELQAKLATPILKQLNQRISVRYNLLPLSRAGIKGYIEHRLMVAGSRGSISFSDRAISIIYKSSCGIPRIINLISDRCLLGGYSMQTTTIDHKIVKEAIESLGGKSVFQGSNYVLT